MYETSWEVVTGEPCQVSSSRTIATAQNVLLPVELVELVLGTGAVVLPPVPVPPVVELPLVVPLAGAWPGIGEPLGLASALEGLASWRLYIDSEAGAVSFWPSCPAAEGEGEVTGDVELVEVEFCPPAPAVALPAVPVPFWNTGGLLVFRQAASRASGYIWRYVCTSCSLNPARPRSWLHAPMSVVPICVIVAFEHGAPSHVWAR